MFKSVNRELLQKAFAVAHRGQHDEKVNAAGRKRLAAIARLLWDSCGEGSEYSRQLDPSAESSLEQLDRIAR